MAEKNWTPTGRLDAGGDPIFLDEQGGLWAVSRKVGTHAQILERLRGGPPIPWSQMERVGQRDDWVISVRQTEESAPWEPVLAAIAARLEPLGEDVRYHDWERGEGFVFRGRIDEARAKLLAEALRDLEGVSVEAQPVLAHLKQD